eukprot:gene7851-10659_t
MLTLNLANKIANKVVETALSNNFAPITICVLDASANVVTLQRMDNCPPVGIPDFAKAKAFTCIAMKVASSRAFRDKYTSDNDPAKFCQMVSMVNITQGQMAPFPGGVILRSLDGIIIGAIGVSGAASDEDELCALEGKRLAAAELGLDLI